MNIFKYAAIMEMFPFLYAIFKDTNLFKDTIDYDNVRVFNVNCAKMKTITTEGDWKLAIFEDEDEDGNDFTVAYGRKSYLAEKHPNCISTSIGEEIFSKTDNDENVKYILLFNEELDVEIQKIAYCFELFIIEDDCLREYHRKEIDKYKKSIKASLEADKRHNTE